MTITTDTELLLGIDRLANSYQGEPLLRQVSFGLGEGEILCLLGPSGSGKTTLLRLLAGLDRPESGRIFLRGRDIGEVPPHQRNFGMMFQEYALFPHRNVRDNIAFGLEMQKMSAPRRQQRVAEMLALIGLTDLAERRIDELSGGERQRVALARSLAPGPQLLLLDEPLGSLDRGLRERLGGEIRTILKKMGLAAIFVTHDQGEAFSIADRIAVLHQGVLQQIGPPEEVYRAPINRLVAGFLGFANLVEGNLAGDGRWHCPLGAFPLADLPARASDGGQTLLIRPEGAKLATTGAEKRMGGLAISGVVVGRQFQGGRYRLTIEAFGQGLIFDLATAPVPPAVGAAITLWVDRQALVWLKS